jgi:hypothetical protein
VVDTKRPMDNMALSLDTPQEDEVAVNVLTAGTSPYMPLVFMTAERAFRPFFSFKAAPPAARARWVSAFLHFLRKLSYRCGGKRLVLKSPVHTARVALLLQLFPQARGRSMNAGPRRLPTGSVSGVRRSQAQFIYIHREPRTVFASACNMADTTYWYMYLCQPSSAQVQDFILDQFVTLWDEYAADRALIPEGNLAEVGYDQLASDPIGTLASVYERLGWHDFGALRPRLEKQLAGHRAYQPNAHSTLPPDLVAPRGAAPPRHLLPHHHHRPMVCHAAPTPRQALVDERWRDYASAWGYR